MASQNVFIILLRRPRVDDPRADPFYEIGSFGCTGCHQKNLLHRRHAAELEGSRLAFAQGGDAGFRLVFLTSPVTVVLWPRFCEVKWTPARMPFKYREAPILVANDGGSVFPLIEAFSSHSARSTIEGGFASRFRSRVLPLRADMADEVVSVYKQHRKNIRLAIAKHYYEALPYVTKIDEEREGRYQRIIRRLRAEKGAGPKC